MSVALWHKLPVCFLLVLLKEDYRLYVEDVPRMCGLEMFVFGQLPGDS